MKFKTKKLDGKSYFPQEEFVKRLKSDFPAVFTEDSKIDIDKLKVAFGENADLGERYGLSWKGKSEVFHTIQETTTKTLKPVRSESADFDNTGNLFIEGDNLEALKILQRSYYGKVKMIYIDPPYNTGNDFVYNDKFAEDRKEYEQEAGIRDGNGDIKEINGLRKNTKDGGHFHSNWLNMMYPRLYLARNLLRQDGVIFVSIDDNESHNLRMIMNEIFGEENFVADLTVVNNLKGRNDKKYVATASERLLMYIKSDEFEEYGLDLPETTLAEYTEEDKDGKFRLLGLRKRGGGDTRADRPNLYFPLYINPKNNRVFLEKTNEFPIEVFPKKSNGVDGRWRWGQDTILKNLNFLTGRTVGENKRYDVFEKDYLEINGEVRRVRPKTVISGSEYSTDVATKSYKRLFPEGEFTNPKPVDLVKDLVKYVTHSKDGDLILDFFAGSGTTAHAVMQLNAEDGGNRKWIMVQLPEETEEGSETRKAGFKTIADIAKERIRRAAKKVKEGDNGQLSLEEKGQDLGFKVFKVDYTNFKIWDAGVKDVEKLEKQMQEMFNTVRDDVTEEDLLFELIIKSGVEPTISREQKEGYWKIGEGELIICLASRMTQELFSSILSEKPQKVILLDKAFASDQLKKNLTLQAEKENIEIRVV